MVPWSCVNTHFFLLFFFFFFFLSLSLSDNPVFDCGNTIGEYGSAQGKGSQNYDFDGSRIEKGEKDDVKDVVSMFTLALYCQFKEMKKKERINYSLADVFEVLKEQHKDDISAEMETEREQRIFEWHNAKKEMWAGCSFDKLCVSTFSDEIHLPGGELMCVKGFFILLILFC